MVSLDTLRLPLPLLVTLALSCALLLPPAAARPPQTSSIEKRVSDQRLAELETLLALAVNNRRMADMPVGFGLIDPHAIGRRKRSAHPLSDALFRELSHSPSSYNSIVQLLNSYLQQEDQEESLQMAKLAAAAGGGAGDYGDRSVAGRNSMI